MLEIKNYTKCYGDKVAVDRLNLSVKAGEIYGFIGHNGAGKSTTIKSIAGILDFEEGDILIDGISIRENPIECKKKMAYIADNPDLYEGLSGIQYLNFIGDMYQVESRLRENLIRRYGDAFEMSDYLGDKIGTYSHGMRQKLAVMSALIHQPKLLILDEPFVGLDPVAAHTLKGMMRECCDQGGAIFFSSHVLEVVEKLCDRISIIKQGKIVVEGEIDEVLKNQSLEEVFLELSQHD